MAPRDQLVPRIAVTVEALWHRVPGGTGRAVDRLVHNLAAVDRFDLVGIAARHGKEEREQIELPIPVEFHRLPRPLLYDLWHLANRPRVEPLTGPVDLIWASALAVPPASVPTVVTVHDIDFLRHPETLNRRGRWFHPQAWAAARDRAARLVCPSKTVAADLIDQGINPDRVSIVGLGVDGVDVSPDDVVRVRALHGLDGPFVLWVGALEPRKNLPRLIAAMRSVPNVPLVLVGPDGWVIDGDDVLAPLGERARRLGRVPDRDLPALYKAATVFALPSLAEGFGLPVLEAMSQGTPVVTSTGTATEEVAGQAAVLVDPTDVEAIAGALNRLLTDPARRRRVGVAGQKRAATRTWADSASGYCRVFEEVLAERPRR